MERSDDTNENVSASGNSPEGKARSVGMLGQKLLLHLLASYKNARSHILGQCLQTLATARPSACSWHLNFLTVVGQKEAEIMMDNFGQILEGLEQLVLLNPENAYKLVRALSPALAVKKAACERAWMVLRKAALCRDQSCRAYAIRGMLFFAVESRNDRSQSLHVEEPMSSQVAASQRGAKQNDFLIEALGFLRRFLNQQASIRKVLYTGIKEVCLADCDAAPYASQLLQQALSRSLKHEDGVTFLDLRVSVPCVFEN